MIVLFWWVVPQAFGLQSVTDPELLCSMASRVVIAEVTSREVSPVADSAGDFETTTWLSVYQILRGRRSLDQTVEVRHQGGTLGSWSHWVEDQPRLALDHRYLLLLDDQTPAQVIGGDLGAIDIGHEPSGLDAALRTLGGCL